MSDKNLPINEKVLANLASLLGQLIENFGGDRQQLAQNLRPPLTVGDLPNAVAPLVMQMPFTAYINDAEGNNHTLFTFKIQTKHRENSGEISQVSLRLIFHHPAMHEPLDFAFLTVGQTYRFVHFLRSNLNTGDDDQSTVHDEIIRHLLKEANDSLGENFAQLLLLILLGLVNSIPAEDLGPKSRKLQTKLNADFGGIEPSGDLALSDKIVARVPEALRFLAQVYGLKEQALFDLFEPTLRESIKENEPLTADNLQESALSHEALHDVTLNVADIDDSGDINLIAFEIPMRNDVGEILDKLAIVFTPDNIEVQLSSESLKIAAKPMQEKEPAFKAKEVAKLVRTSENLSGDQAAANKALLENALRTLAKSATGRSSKKLQELLILLASFS